MKIKTSDLKGAALDWAMTQCGDTHEQTLESLIEVEGTGVYKECKGVCSKMFEWSPVAGDTWEAIHGLYYAGEHEGPQQGIRAHGPTALIAAKRCYVRVKLGDEVDVPDEIVFTSEPDGMRHYLGELIDPGSCSVEFPNYVFLVANNDPYVWFNEYTGGRREYLVTEVTADEYAVLKKFLI